MILLVFFIHCASSLTKVLILLLISLVKSVSSLCFWFIKLIGILTLIHFEVLQITILALNVGKFQILI